MSCWSSVVLRRLVLLAALALGSCGGGGSVGDAPDSGTSIGSDIGSGGTGVAGVGSGGTGIGSGGTGIGSGGTGVAGGGEGVGSGGTGVTADAGVGSVDGFGSIIVNGVRYDIGTATTILSDVSSLKLGMTVRVTGTINPDMQEGTATLVVSEADLRGAAAAVSATDGTFTVLGVQVNTDASTVYAGGLSSFGGLRNGTNVQVHGLPGDDGQLHATRVERLAAAQPPVLTGYVQALDRGARTFLVGTQLVSYAAADFPGDWPSSRLAEGVLVRVRAAGVAPTLAATTIEPWNPTPLRDGSRLSLGGLVSDYASVQSLRIDGVPADISAAKVLGSGNAVMANGARVDATGTMLGGVLQVATLRIRQLPPATTAVSVPAAQETSFSARGSVGAYRSPADFKVQGQDIDASNATFVGGTAADLGPSRKVLVTGAHVRDDVLVADRVEFLN